MFFMAASAFISLNVYKNKNKEFKYLNFFPPILFFTLTVELIGLYKGSKGQNNITLYNFFTVFWISYHLLIISFIIANSSLKNIIRLSSIAYVFLCLTNILFIQKIKIFHTVTYSIGCLLIVLFCIYYFLELFRNSKSIDLKKNPAFWICSGLLFFCCCGFPLYGFINVWATVPFIVKSFQHIVSILNIFLYTLLSIGFLCNRNPKYTLS